MASLAQNVFGNNRTYPPGTPVMLGIDEAGRGPVLGPMVYGCAYCPLSREKDLKSSGYADSKTLSEEQRENLFEKICACDYVGWSVEVISAARLSEHMLRVKKYNLNLISHDSAAGLVRRTLALGVNVCKVFVDTVGDPEKYQAKLSGMFPSIEFKVAKKADSLFPCVSAASICAKVVRDRDIKAWRPSESNQGHTAVALGSGYPADPFTKAWLRSNLDPVFGFPRLVRFSWQTVTTLLLENGGVPMLVPADEEDAAESGGGWQRGEQTPKVSQFFAPVVENTPKRPRLFCSLGVSSYL